MSNLAELKAAIERDGFARFENCFDESLIKLAQAELNRLFEIDLASREKAGVKGKTFDGPVGRSSLDTQMHLLEDVYGKSPALDLIFNFALTDPDSAGLLKHVGGNNLKLRGYNVRRMTGATRNSDMEWHRDNKGEIGWTFLLTDTDPYVDASTTFVRGSHLYPYSSRENLLFPWRDYSGFKIFQKINYFGNLIRKRYVDTNSVSASGKAGTFYLFINDLWHGREHNLNGKETMIFLVSVFPAEIPFPNQVPIPDAETLGRLPAAVKLVVDYQNTPFNLDKRAYLYKMWSDRLSINGLWRLGLIERRLIDLLSLIKIAPISIIKGLYGLAIKMPFLRRIINDLRN